METLARCKLEYVSPPQNSEVICTQEISRDCTHRAHISSFNGGHNAHSTVPSRAGPGEEIR